MNYQEIDIANINENDIQLIRNQDEILDLNDPYFYMLGRHHSNLSLSKVIEENTWAINKPDPYNQHNFSKTYDEYNFSRPYNNTYFNSLGFFKPRNPMKKILFHQFNRDLAMCQYSIKNQKKPHNLGKDQLTLKRHISTQTLKIFFMRTKNFCLYYPLFFRHLHLFKRLKNLNFKLDPLIKYWNIRNSLSLKNLLSSLDRVTLSLNRNNPAIGCIYNNKTKTLTVNHDFSTFVMMSNKIWRLFIPRMKEIFIRNLSDHRNHKFPDFRSIFPHQNHLRSIFIDLTDYKISYNIFRSLLLKYRPYCEIINIDDTSFGKIIQEDLKFNFFFIQKNRRLIVNMDQKILKLPHAMIENVPAKQDDILFAQKFENGKKEIYIYPNAGYIQSGFFIGIKYDQDFFVMNDGVRISEENVFKFLTQSLSEDKKQTLKVPEKTKWLTVKFENDIDFFWNLTTRLEWIRKKDYLTNLQNLFISNLEIGEEDITWNLIFDYIKEKKSQLKEVSLDYKKIESFENEGFFMSLMSTICHIPNVTVKLINSCEVRIIEASNKEIEVFLDVRSSCIITKILLTLNQTYNHLKKFSFKMSYWIPEVFQEFCNQIESLMLIDKLDIIIESSQRVDPADLLILTGKLSNCMTIKYLNLELSSPELKKIKETIKEVHNRLINNSPKCTLVSIWLKNVEQKDFELERLEKIQFTIRR